MIEFQVLIYIVPLQRKPKNDFEENLVVKKQTLKYLIINYGQEEVLYALNECSRVEKFSVGYMEGILRNRSGENEELYFDY